MATDTKYYRISMWSEYAEGACYRKLTDTEYDLIKNIFDECNECGSIEEVEPKWVVEVRYEVNHKHCKQNNQVILHGRRFVPVNENSSYRRDVFMDLPEQPGYMPERCKFFFYDDFMDEYLKEANIFCEQLDCSLTNYSIDDLKMI